MRKLPIGQHIHAQESKHDKRYCSCWVDCDTDDHLLQCPERTRHKNEIYQAIKQLGKEMDSVLHDILRDGVAKYIGGKEQTIYNIDGTNINNYWQLRKNQQEIGWDNLFQGKLSKDWRKLQHNYKQKMKDIQKNISSSRLNAIEIQSYLQIWQRKRRRRRRRRNQPNAK